MQTFSFRTSLRKSWSIFKNHWTVLLLLPIAVFIGSMLLSIVPQIFQNIPVLFGLLTIIFFFVKLAYDTAFTVGYTKINLHAIDEKHVSWKTIMTPWRAWVAYLATSILFILIILGAMLVYALGAALVIGILYLIFGVLLGINFGIVATILAVIAGIILFVGLIYVSLRVTFIKQWIWEHYEHQKVFQMLKTCWHSTQGHTSDIFFLIIKIVLLNILGAVLLLVGLLVTVPLSTLIMTDYYRKHIRHIS